MPEQVKTVWLYDDAEGKRISPATLINQVYTIDGETWENTLPTVAKTGNYADLIGAPDPVEVPNNLSQFTDDLGSSPTHTHSQYLTEHQSLAGLAVDNVAALTDSELQEIMEGV